MKRILFAALAALILITTITSCAAAPESSSSPGTTISPESNVRCAAVLLKLDEYLENDQLGFKVTWLPEVDLGDGRDCQPIVVEESISGDKFHIHVYANENGHAETVNMTVSNPKEYVNVTFALLSYYLYDSMGITTIEPDAFYDHFKFFEDDEDIDSLEVDGWYFSKNIHGNTWTFGGTYNLGG